jgi:hypothetical protein
MLGAIAEQLEMPHNKLATIRASLNPLSRFDFGSLSALEHSGRWQAKERKQQLNPNFDEVSEPEP